MTDNTLLYYTGHLPPEPFLNKVRAHLVKVAGPLPIISVSHHPIDLGTNIPIGPHPKQFYTAQMQILIGLNNVKTKYVVLCEDDTLYPAAHLWYSPPRDDFFYYNTNRWVCEGFYWYAHRSNMSQLICNTELLRNFMETRMSIIKGPDDPNLSYCSEPGRYQGKHDKHLGIMGTKAVRTDLTETPIIGFNLRTSLGKKRKVSPNAKIRSHLPEWGSAQSLWQEYVRE